MLYKRYINYCITIPWKLRVCHVHFIIDNTKLVSTDISWRSWNIGYRVILRLDRKINVVEQFLVTPNDVFSFVKKTRMTEKHKKIS